MNLEKALAFIRRECNEVECARLDYLLTDTQPSPAVVATLFAGQRSDGGWAPFWTAGYSSLDATCFRLAQAEQIGIGAEQAVVERAVAFLAQRQAPDGSWQEEEKVAAATPPWARPGELSATLYLTANCGFWLAILGNHRDNALRAASYLQAHLHEQGRLPSFLHTHWLAGGLCHHLAQHEPAEQLFAYLGSRIADLTASNLSWLITTLVAAGVATEHPLLNSAASRLQRSQEDDGRWRSEDGPGQDVHMTLEALRGLHFCDRLQWRA